MKKLFKLFIMFILVISFFSFNSMTTEAATKKIAHVNIKSGTLSIKSKADIKAKKIGELKKDEGVYVYSKTKSGWSEIRYKKKKAYVMTKYLKFANSYLMDKTKVYRYMYMGDGGIEEYVYEGKNSQGWDMWKIYEGNNKFICNHFVYEDKNGLYEGWPQGSNDEFFSPKYNKIKYPVKVGKTFYDVDYDDYSKSRITSVSKTVKTPAGIFKNCIEVTDSYGKSYFAKNVGFVKRVFPHGDGHQLIRLENK